MSGVQTSVGLADDLVYDVGMHRGEDTAYYLAKGFRVVAFEAEPQLVERCRERFARELAEGRLRIIHGAIVPSGGSEFVEFYRHSTLTMWGTTDADWVGRREEIGGFEKISVPAVDFAGVLADTGVPHYMKIDIEGADELCLRALLNFEERPRFLSIESEKFDFGRLEREFELLAELGFDRFAVIQQGGIPGSTITTSRRDGSLLEYRFEKDASGAFGSDIGPWTDRQAALRRYRRIFREYRAFGEDSLIRRTRAGRVVLARLPRLTGRSWPGWYDTHAARD